MPLAVSREGMAPMPMWIVQNRKTNDVVRMRPSKHQVDSPPLLVVEHYENQNVHRVQFHVPRRCLLCVRLRFAYSVQRAVLCLLLPAFPCVPRRTRPLACSTVHAIRPQLALSSVIHASLFPPAFRGLSHAPFQGPLISKASNTYHLSISGRLTHASTRTVMHPDAEVVPAAH